MKKVKHILVSILTVGLLLTSLAGCGEQKEQKKETINQEKPVATEAPVVTETPTATEAPASSAPDNEEKDKKNYLNYTLSEENIATFETQLLLCEQMLQDEVPYSDMEVEVQILEELERGIRYQAIIAEIMYDCDTRNEKAAENYLFSAEVASEISAEKNLFHR